MSEDEYLAIVERIQQAMAIEPFQPSVIDVVKLLSDWRDWSKTRHLLAEEREAWKTRALEESAENDQWQKKQTESWAEIERLRQRLADAENAQAELDRIRKAEIERLQAEVKRLLAGWQESVAESQAEIERLRAALQARGPYCAQHGELQPCSQHRWALGSDKAK